MAWDSLRRVLIANRGEIADRILRACADLDVASICIFTDPDREAPYLARAGRRIEVSNYLAIDEIVAAALAGGADAIHPGYGFLSERADFARAIERAGLRLIGPTAEVIELLGRKDRAREIALAAGAPVVPASVEGGFPVLVKAASGGGGKGMRIVRSEADLEAALAAARRESLAAFGDDTLLIEKYVERGRHIEVQVFGDHAGNVVHFFERDCSVQRRHQKVIEEAPAPTITEDQRAALTQAAIALSREVGYTNAGTVEFLLDPSTGDAFFLEMNTRLQVEHAVTEAITGVDLVALQLRIAAGERLMSQHEITRSGHAIEARIYAEDPYTDFLPQAGTVSRADWPAPPSSVHTAITDGSVIGTAYDPMVAKIVVSGRTRAEAISHLVGALDETRIFGLTTNAGFARTLVASDEFAAAEIDTAWLDRATVERADPAYAREIAAQAVAAGLDPQPGPWQLDGWRSAGPSAPLTIALDDVLIRPDTVAPHIGGRAIVRRHEVEVVERGQRWVFTRPDAYADHGPHVGNGTINAPMPGTVLAVQVEPGTEVAEGDTLGIVEAMKMELRLTAPFAGRVAQVNAVVGQRVGQGEPLFVVDPAIPPGAED
jgi:3-methylcrotonyl-CoA carboxylase alpha subunit/acetyl-CoA/propionyl-CoA carboxylase biotin carboxyl carrier protein